MVLLAKREIATKEVLDWQGIHLLHYSGSACSKKIRIFLDLKNIDWVSHPVNLIKREHNRSWFMGVNPRGLVPVLVHDGDVHIESNDILAYLDNMASGDTLIPLEQKDALSALLETEDHLHMDLRNLTLRFSAPSKLMQRSRDQLLQFKDSGSDLVGGTPDDRKILELQYWQQFAENNGITDRQVVQSVNRFKEAFEHLDGLLKTNRFLLGDKLTLADISWFVNLTRIQFVGYPLQHLHPNLWAWLQSLLQMPAFAAEAGAPFMQTLAARGIRIRDVLMRKTLRDIAGL